MMSRASESRNGLNMGKSLRVNVRQASVCRDFVITEPSDGRIVQLEFDLAFKRARPRQVYVQVFQAVDGDRLFDAFVKPQPVRMAFEILGEELFDLGLQTYGDFA